MFKCKKVFNTKLESTFTTLHPSPHKNHIQNPVLHATENHLQQSVPGYIIRRQFSFGDIFLFIGDIILSFGDNFLFFGNISSIFKIRHKNIIFANFISRIHTIVTNRITTEEENRIFAASIRKVDVAMVSHDCQNGPMQTHHNQWNSSKLEPFYNIFRFFSLIKV